MSNCESLSNSNKSLPLFEKIAHFIGVLYSLPTDRFCMRFCVRFCIRFWPRIVSIVDDTPFTKVTIRRIDFDEFANVLRIKTIYASKCFNMLHKSTYSDLKFMAGVHEIRSKKPKAPDLQGFSDTQQRIILSCKVGGSDWT